MLKIMTALALTLLAVSCGGGESPELTPAEECLLRLVPENRWGSRGPITADMIEFCERQYSGDR